MAWSPPATSLPGLLLDRLPQLREAPWWVIWASTYPFPIDRPVQASEAFQFSVMQQPPLINSKAEFRRKLKEGALTVNGERLQSDRTLFPDSAFIEGWLVLGVGRRLRFWDMAAPEVHRR